MSSSVLPNGGHVVIIGGGPGGASCALALQRLAAQMGRKVHITVLEGKRFVGEHHYNQCVGVLSPPLPALLKEFLDLDFPYHLSRGLIREYVLHATGQTLSLHGECEPSIALRRVQFDAWFLETVRERGIRVQEARAVDLEFHADRVVVYTESAPLEADVVVGAFGLDEGTGALFRRHTGYFPPRALSSIVTKYHPYPEHLVPLQGRIHAFLPRDPRIEFGAVTPKGNHLTINIAGQDVDVNLMQAFLDSPEVHAVLPDLEGARARHEGDLRFFKGRFPCSLAKRFYGDRYVLVGDAAGLVRAFKGKGVTSAVQSGIRAAETILRHGITRAAFHAHYRMANQDIIRDLPYGQAMRRLTIFAARTGLFRAVMSAARSNPSLQRALFDAVSAHAP
ncbi:MAG: NAD(P)/FAD-dependent oxidoreductase, partial [Anaerolineae bacterium]